jgi:hypothetical protein
MKDVKGDKANVVVFFFGGGGSADLKGPSHKIRFAWEWYGSIGLG